MDSRKTDAGIILPVSARPGSGRDAIKGLQGGTLKVAVTQVAEKGKANRAIIGLLSKRLKLKKSQIQIVSGETSRQKQFLIRGETQEGLEKRLAKLALDVQ